MSEFASENQINPASDLSNGDVAAIMENFQAKKTATMLNRLNCNPASNGNGGASNTGVVAAAAAAANNNSGVVPLPSTGAAPSQLSASSRMKRSSQVIC